MLINIKKIDRKCKSDTYQNLWFDKYIVLALFLCYLLTVIDKYLVMKGYNNMVVSRHGVILCSRMKMLSSDNTIKKQHLKLSSIIWCVIIALYILW